MAPGILTDATPPSPERGSRSRSPQEQSLLDSTADQEWVGRRPSDSSGRETKRVRRSPLFARRNSMNLSPNAQNVQNAQNTPPLKLPEIFQAQAVGHRRRTDPLQCCISPTTPPLLFFPFPNTPRCITPAPSPAIVDHYFIPLPCTTITSA